MKQPFNHLTATFLVIYQFALTWIFFFYRCLKSERKVSYTLKQHQYISCILRSCQMNPSRMWINMTFSMGVVAGEIFFSKNENFDCGLNDDAPH